MSMYPDPESFDQLRRLLALKRHEEPPPGYFHKFSGQVIARIRAGERPAPGFSRLFLDAPWLQRLWAALEARPVLAGSMGVGCCALLLASVVLFDGNTDLNSAQSVAPQAIEASLGFSPRSSRASGFEPAALADFQLTNSFTSSQGSLFPVQPVNFIQGN
jgi:hypothetical protein